MKSEILAALEASTGKVKVKHIQKEVLASCPGESEDDFNKALKSLEKKSKIEIIDDKYIVLAGGRDDDSSSKKQKKEKKSKPERNNVDEEEEEEENYAKAKPQEEDNVISMDAPVVRQKGKKVASKDTFELWKNGEAAWRNNTLEFEYLASNPDKITRLFCGNLNKNITEEQLKEHLPGISFIKWIRDKETGDFYGTTFLEMEDPKSAASAVLKDRTKYLGRQLKIYYCPPKPGDIWPPITGSSAKPSGVTSSGGAGGGFNQREKMPKPPNCCKLFMGNLSYNIDDESICEFFKDCGGEIVGLRWLSHKESGDFKGCGYIEFDNTESADKGFLLDGAMLLGRPIRIDWG
jgi:nucleolin